MRRVVIAAVALSSFLPAWPVASQASRPARKAVAANEWSISKTTNPLDDTTTTTASLNAVEKNARLMVRCKSNQLDVIVSWGLFIGGSTADITIRFDSEPADTVPWNVSTDNKALLASYPAGFVESLLGAKRLIMQVTPYGRSPVLSTFAVKGAERALSALAPCGQ